MDLAAALRAGPALLRRRPAGVLPYYLLVASVPTIARVPLVIAIGAAGAWLAATGRLDPVFDALRELDLAERTGAGPGTGGPTGGVGSGAPGGPDLPPGLGDALAGLVTPTTVVLVGAGAAATLALAVLARAATAAGALSAVERALAGDDPLPAGARGIDRYWRPFLGLALLRLGVRIAAVVAVAVVVAVAAAGTGVGGAVAVVAALVGGVAGLLALAAFVGAELGLAFAGAAVVVDDAGTGAAVRRGFGLARERPAAVLLYLVVAAGVLVGVGAAGLVFAAAGIARVLGLVTALVAFPALDGVRVALYAERGPDALPDPDASAPGRLAAATRDGLRELGRFVVGHPAANAGGAALLGVGAALGWLVVAPHDLGLSPPADAEVFGAVPVGAFVNIAANNWLVTAGAGYGGLALGVPAAAALLLNGALIGAVAAAFEPVPFLALVAPHGVVELPAIAVGGGLGLHLGRVGWDALRGRRDAAAVGDALGRTLRVLLGLAVVLVVAAAIEAFVTPAVAARVLG